MATINDRAVIDKLIATNGADSPKPVIKIVEYTNFWGSICWGLIYEGQALDTYTPTDYVINPTTIWERK